MKRSRAVVICAAVFLTAAMLYFMLFRSQEPRIFELDTVSNSEGVVYTSHGADIVGDGIEIISIPSSLERGSEAEVKLRGNAGEEFEIRVYYASGISQSKSFSPACADENGEFSWKWTVSGNARKGNIRVIVTGESCRVSFYVEII